MPSVNKPILIIGGGIGGMSAAIALSRIGRRVELFEQADSFKEIGAGIQLGPNAFQMFDALGVRAEIDKIAVFPDALIVMDSLSGEQLSEIATRAAFRERFGNPYGLIHRADLHAVLVKKAAVSPLITLHAGKKAVAISEDGDGVEAVMENGERFRGAALIGADGLWSVVRAAIVGDGPPRVSGHIAYRAVLPVVDVPDVNKRNAMTVWMGPKTHLVHYPLRQDSLYNLVAVFHSSRCDEGWDSYGDPAELNEHFAGARDEVRGILSKIETWRMWVLCDREPIKDWSRGRIALLGDAAHPMLQYMAQGATMSMEDAVCLAKLLEGEDKDIARALLAYQAKRYLRTTRVQLTARLYGEAYHAGGATRDLRNAFLKSRTQQQSYDSLDWMYNPEEVICSVY